MRELATMQDQRDAWRRLAEARADLLTCYRIGVGSGDRRAERALIRIDNAKGELRRLGVEIQP